MSKYCGLKKKHYSTWSGATFNLVNQGTKRLAQYRCTLHYDKTDNRRLDNASRGCNVNNINLDSSLLIKSSRKNASALDLAPLLPPCRLGNKSCDAPRNRFQPIFNNINWHCFILPVVFSKQPPNHAVPCQLPPARRKAHWYAQSHPPFNCKRSSIVSL